MLLMTVANQIPGYRDDHGDLEIDPTGESSSSYSKIMYSDVPAADITGATGCEAENRTAAPVVAFVSDVSDGDTVRRLLPGPIVSPMTVAIALPSPRRLRSMTPSIPRRSPAPVTVECIGDVPAADIHLVVTDEADTEHVGGSCSGVRE